MTDMIERVARAVDIADGEFIVFYPGDPLEARADSKWSETIARAAIMAMREPAEAMIDRFVSRALCVSVHGEGGWSNYGRGQWQTMIDGALNANPKG